ncbi:unnamed protein product [Periconia digitata]|uniref:Sulfatase N-terminal domain-containing protein n=1 Tax=Periconia digitata TaxID=1303443 RepID=A0A9W4U2J1_9PLEO|nr:unnamed protein product [Periconia digitata]
MMLSAIFLHAMMALVVASQDTAEKKGKPNFIIIMTDDQDLHLNSLDYQPAVQKHFAEQGTFYQKHFVTMAQCCPSRVSLLTGMAGHNTNVTDVFPPDVLLDPYTYLYYNATLQRNQDPPRSFPGEYNTDIIKEKALGFLDDAAAADEPFFIGVMPIAPHTESPASSGGQAIPEFFPPIPAKRHENLFQGAKIPRTYSFNPDRPSGGSYVKLKPKMNDTVLEYNDEFYRLRLATLAAVDDIINEVFEKLEEHNLLDNTYVIYTTDNGFHMGQHRLDPGKACPYEEDVNVPMFIRGPNVPKGVTNNSTGNRCQSPSKSMRTRVLNT